MKNRIEYAAETRFEDAQGRTYIVLLENGVEMYESKLVDYEDWFIVTHNETPVEYTMSVAEELYMDVMRWCAEGKRPKIRRKVDGEKHFVTYWYKMK